VLPFRPAAALLVTAGLLAGCGGTPDAPPSSTDRAAIQKRYALYMTNVVKRNGKRACAQFTPASRDQSDQIAQAAGYSDCAMVIELATWGIEKTAPKGLAEQIAHPEKVIVTMHGGRAQAEFPGAVPGDITAPVTLERVGKRWLIDGSRIVLAG
jgi:hypothetical protein